MELHEYGEIGVGRAGRKRKAGKRYPSGQLVVDKQPDDRLRVSRQPHRRTLKKELRDDDRAESAFGRLCLRGLITPDQYDAGQRYAAAVGSYRAVIAAPKALGGSGRGYSCGAVLVLDGGVDCLFAPETCECLRREQRYNRAFEELTKAGQRAAKIVARVVVHQEDLAPEDIVYLKAGLDCLRRLYGLTGSARKAHYENAN